MADPVFLNERLAQVATCLYAMTRGFKDVCTTAGPSNIQPTYSNTGRSTIYNQAPSSQSLGYSAARVEDTMEVDLPPRPDALMGRLQTSNYGPSRGRVERIG